MISAKAYTDRSFTILLFAAPPVTPVQKEDANAVV